MIVRREWFRQAIARVLAAWGAGRVVGQSGAAWGQTAPSKKSTTKRYAARKPALSTSKNSTRSLS